MPKNLRDAECCGHCKHCDIDPYERVGDCMHHLDEFGCREHIDSHDVCDQFEAYEED